MCWERWRKTSSSKILFVTNTERGAHILDLTTRDIILYSKFFPIVFNRFDHFIGYYFCHFFCDSKARGCFDRQRNRDAIIVLVHIKR